ncbi:uncharacterized protein LOC126742831 [Anthonomus grandis grandis]|uniref:uncharacterized protein LOC126742831 n=1 Tax=Anthonomus grandis grandis TaxID=2921223 RepID=UPI002166124C|nr:uncharacterized protein LOC126742831 [Anthonomus grandis grandis]
MSDKLKRAKVLRQTEFNRLSDILNISRSAKEDTSQHIIFKLSYDILESIRTEFFKQHNVVISCILDDEDQFTEQDAVRSSFEKDFWYIKSIYFKLFGESLTTNISSSSSSNQSHVTLPKLEIPSFSGNITQFATFKDMFNALIHNNSTLRNIEKFNYLLNFLRGQPLTLIQKLPMTDVNYTTAYEMLVKRYENPRLVAATHWAAIENTTKLTTENPAELRQLLDTFSDNLAALGNLNFPVALWDFILVQMLLKRLHVSIATEFELQYDSHTTPSFQQLTTYLHKRCAALDNVCSALHEKDKKSLKREDRFSNSKVALLGTEQSKSSSCAICKTAHSVYRCPIFLTKTPNNRYQLVKSLKMCLNCLSSIHSVKECKSPHVCHKCRQKHHTLLHFERNYFSGSSSSTTPPALSSTSSIHNDQPSSSQADSRSTNSSHLVASSLNNYNSSNVLLSTALIDMLDGSGTFQKIRIRILLDSGSQLHFISQNCVKRLGLTSYKTPCSVQGIGEAHVQNCARSVFTKIRPCNKFTPNFDLEAAVLPKICGLLPSHPISTTNWPHLRSASLADPFYDTPRSIDLLIGAPLFPYILLEGRLTGDYNEPVGFNTVFGFILMGKTVSNSSPIAAQSLLCYQASVNDTLQKFWEVEEVPHVKVLSPEDEKCENIFRKTTYRNRDGRFVVSLPFRGDEPIFYGSRELALCNFLSLERRLQQNPKLSADYAAFIKEYLDQNHMEIVSSDLIPKKSFYIPHHCVLKDSSPTTKLRVVFNASAKPLDGMSLNDHLLSGPKL